MCDLCARVKANYRYRGMLAEMQQKDAERLMNTKEAAESFSSISVYSTIEYPANIVQPMFEAKQAAMTPINYFQPLFVNEEKAPPNFSSGATRSLFFLGKRLMLFSKLTSTQNGREFFPFFLLAHFEPEEYSASITPEGRIEISANCEKLAKNLVSGGVEKIKIEFAFVHENLEGKVAEKSSASPGTLAQYIVKAQHFAPHPYLQGIATELGYKSVPDFQLHVVDYFREHIEQD